MRINKKLLVLAFTLLLFQNLSASDLLTVAEKSNYTKTTLYEDVMNFLFEVQKKSDLVKILTLGKSHEGRTIPLVVISEQGISSAYEMRMIGKPVVLIQANIHAGEVEGKEACLMLIRDIVNGKLKNLLQNQVILVIPDLNADGNEKLAKGNRRDNGPELAGVRHNGQNLDLNRDYLKLKSPEITALVKLFNEWDPVLFVDMHTKNGSYHQEPVTYCTLSNPNSYIKMLDYMWQKLFPEVQQNLKKQFGYDAIPYGNFVDRTNPEKGWENSTCEARYGTNYAGLRNRFTILDENYPHADFKTRVLSSYGFIQSILQFTNKNITEMQKIVKTADFETKQNFRSQEFVLEYSVENLFDLTVKSYEFELEEIKPEDRDKYPSWVKDFIVKKTDVKKNYKLSYFARPKPTRSIKLPRGYVVLAHHNYVIENLKKHGIVVEKIRTEVHAEVEQFVINEITLSDRIYQGCVFVELKGEYKAVDVTIPPNSFFISLKQPLARLIPVLLEPESVDSLVCWSFFNKVLVRQWGKNRPNFYPVYRIHDSEVRFELIQE